jgi:ABC-type antimicrobial peptide transport system permease subunit
MLLLRHDGDYRQLIEALRPAILAVDHDLLIVRITTMSDHIGMGLLPLRIASISSLIFGGLGLMLSGLGIYGLISYFAGQRTREIGVRLALGAQRKDILKLVLSQGIAIVVIGIAVGIGGAFAATRLLTSFLIGVGPTDALTFALVAASLAIVALLACWIPARRATKVDPLVALRHE